MADRWWLTGGYRWNYYGDDSWQKTVIDGDYSTKANPNQQLANWTDDCMMMIDDINYSDD